MEKIENFFFVLSHEINRGTEKDGDKEREREKEKERKRLSLRDEKKE